MEHLNVVLVPWETCSVVSGSQRVRESELQTMPKMILDTGMGIKVDS